MAHSREEGKDSGVVALLECLKLKLRLAVQLVRSARRNRLGGVGLRLLTSAAFLQLMRICKDRP
jgi:hypothetical protein